MPTDSATLRRWAMECAAKADDPKIQAADRERLLTMRQALLEVAKTQDWLDGRNTPPPSKPKPPPPAQQQQQRQPGRRTKASRATRLV